MGVVYLAFNKINGKSYVGKTIKSLIFRKNEHIRYAKDNRPFHNAIRKYGENSFIWRILFRSNNEQKLNEMEIYYIQKLKTKIPFGYNLANGGQGSSGSTKKESVRQILREKAINQFNDPILRIKHKKAMEKWAANLSSKMRKTLSDGGKKNKGIPKPEGFGEKVSKSLKGKYSGVNSYNYGKKDSLEVRKRKSEGAKNKPPVSEITKEKLRKINLGKHNSKESKEKNKLKALQQWADPKFREKIKLKKKGN